MATGGRAWGGDRARAGAAGAGGGCGGAMAERGPAFCGLYDTSSLLQYCNGENPLLSSDPGPAQGGPNSSCPNPFLPSLYLLPCERFFLSPYQQDSDSRTRSFIPKVMILLPLPQWTPAPKVARQREG